MIKTDFSIRKNVKVGGYFGRVGGKYTFFPKSKRDPKFDEFNLF